MATPAPLTIELFGTMRVLVAGEALPPVRSRKSLWLLALLALRRGRPVSREWLALTLWPDAERTVAFNNLRPAVSDLRRALGTEGSRLQSLDRNTVRFDLEGADVDAVAFESAVDAGDTEAAAALYRGSLLEGCPEEWVPQERNLREQACLQVLQSLGDAALSRGQHERAVAFFTRAAALDPWRDAPRRGLMSAHAESGDVNAALQVYREFAHLLSQEAALQPDEKTMDQYRCLRAAARKAGAKATAAETAGRTGTAVRTEAVGHLPHALTPLIGREDERLDVAAAIRACRLVTLKGTGGLGKTRLALAVASDMANEFPDGAWFVALEALTDERLIPNAFALLMGLREETGKSPLAGLVAALKGKRLLVVLDNCEHLLAACAEVGAVLLRECADVRVLATSREALGIVGERLWPVPTLIVPDPESLPQGRATLLRVLEGYESVRLFVERAQAVQPAFELTAENARAVARICAELDGVPLAIELAAARARSMPADGIAERLGDHLRLLTGGSRTALSRQQTLRSAIDWSYELLTSPERVLLSRLAVFAGGWTMEAAERVAGAAPLDPLDVPDGLQSLVDKSIVVFDAPTGRFRFLESVRQYAAERLAASDEADAAAERRHAWTVDLAESSEAKLVGPEQRACSKRLAADLDNFRAALADGESAPVAGLRLAGALTRLWHVLGRFAEGRQELCRGLARPGAEGRTAERAKALNGLGALANAQSDLAAAEAAWTEALAIREDLGEPAALAEALSNLGTVTAERRKHEQALALYERSLALYEGTGDRLGLAFVLLNQGWIHQERAEFAPALRLLRQAQAIFRELDHPGMQAWMLQMIAEVRFQQGEFVEVRALLEDALERFHAAGNARGVATAQEGFARALVESDLTVSVDGLLRESLESFREIGVALGIGNALLSLGYDALRKGRNEDAGEFMEEGLRTFRRVGDPRGEADALEGLGAVCHAREERAEALVRFRASLALRGELQARRGVAESLEWIGASLDEPRRSAVLWGAAEVLREEIGAPMPPSRRTLYARSVAQARDALGPVAFATACNEGRALGTAAAIVLAGP